MCNKVQNKVNKNLHATYLDMNEFHQIRKEFTLEGALKLCLFPFIFFAFKVERLFATVGNKHFGQSIKFEFQDYLSCFFGR